MELETVPVRLIDAKVFAVRDDDPVETIVRLVELKKFPVVNVPLVQLATTSFVIASAVPVHSMIA
jgi:hypothetical protein